MDTYWSFEESFIEKILFSCSLGPTEDWQNFRSDYYSHGFSMLFFLSCWQNRDYNKIQKSKTFLLHLKKMISRDTATVYSFLISLSWYKYHFNLSNIWFGNQVDSIRRWLLLIILRNFQISLAFFMAHKLILKQKRANSRYFSFFNLSEIYLQRWETVNSISLNEYEKNKEYRHLRRKNLMEETEKEID